MGGRAGRKPPRLGPKQFFGARFEMCKPPFACQNVLILKYINLEFQNFRESIPDFKGRGGEGGEREGRREGKDREGRDGVF